MNVEAVVFDFGGVMVQVYRAEHFRELEDRLGLDAGSLSEILWRSPEWRQAEVGGISDEEYWQRIGPRLGLHTAEGLAGFQQDLYAGLEADRRMVGLVRGLRGRYHTGLLSNTNVRSLERLPAGRGLVGLFDVEVLSAAVGLAKPDPAIFRLALDRLGTAPEMTVFVDDYGPNVTAAAALGMRGIRFVGYEELVAALGEQGVEVGVVGGLSK